MQTYLLVVYVTLEQENAIKQLYLKRGWTLKRAGSIASEKYQYEVTAPSKLHSINLENLPNAVDGECEQQSEHINFDSDNHKEVEQSFTSFKPCTDNVDSLYSYAKDDTRTRASSKFKSLPDVQSSNMEISVTEKEETECDKYSTASFDYYKLRTSNSHSFPSTVDSNIKLENTEKTSETVDEIETYVEANCEVAGEGDDRQVGIHNAGEKVIKSPGGSEHKLKKSRLVKSKHKRKHLLNPVAQECKSMLTSKYEEDSEERGYSYRDIKVKTIARVRKKGKPDLSERKLPRRNKKATTVTDDNKADTIENDINKTNKKESGNGAFKEEEKYVSEEKEEVNTFSETIKSNSTNGVSNHKSWRVKNIKKEENSSNIHKQRLTQTEERISENLVTDNEDASRQELNLAKVENDKSTGVKLESDERISGAKNTSKSHERTTTHKNSFEPGGYKCGYCSRVFLKEMHFKNHIEKHKTHAFDCPECGKHFSNRRNLNSHMFNRTKSRKFNCDICDFETTTACTLRSHKKKTHPPEIMFQCHLCAKIVKTKSYLNVHLKYVHKIDDGKYECPICGQKSKRPKLFAKHLKEHSNSDYSGRQCSECGKVFRTKSHLRNHMRYHRERTYLCDFCGKGFTTQTKLEAHHRTHTGDKPYRCTLCDYKSTQNGNLRLHMKVHQKEDTKQKQAAESQDISSPPNKQIKIESGRESTSVLNLHSKDEKLNKAINENTKTLPSYAEYLDSAIRSSSVGTPNSVPNYAEKQEQEMTTIPTAIQVFPGVQSLNTANCYSTVSTNVCLPQHEKSNYQIQQSPYLSLEHAQNMAEVEKLKSSISLPKITDLSKNLKRRKSSQTLYAAEHAEHVPVHMLSEINNLHTQSSTPSQLGSQFSELPLYSNTQTEEYSETTQLSRAYSQSGNYVMSGSVMESSTQGFSDNFEMENRTEKTIGTATEGGMNIGNTAVNEIGRSEPLELDQTAAIEQYGASKMGYVSVAAPSLHYNKQEKVSNVLSQSLEYGHAAEMNVSTVQYAQSNLMDEMQLSQSRNSPNFYAEAARASLTDTELHTSIADSSAMYHLEGKLDFTNTSHRVYFGNNASNADFAYSPDQMYERQQTGTEYTDQTRPSFTDLQPPEYTTM